jgi:hypothetical protein
VEIAVNQIRAAETTKIVIMTEDHSQVSTTAP